MPELAILLYPTSTRRFSQGFFGNGLIPIRKNLSQFGFPLDGTKASSEWAGFVPRADQPRVVDPKKGFIVVANNKFATDNIRHGISLNIQSTPRALRLTQLIEAKIARGEKFSPEDMIALQSDVVDAYMERALPAFVALARQHLPVYVESDVERARLTNLVEDVAIWNSEYTADSVPAAIMLAWEYALQDSLFRSEFPDDEMRRTLVFKQKCIISDHFLLKQVQQWARGEALREAWCVNEESTRLGRGKECAYQLVHALREANRLLTARFGTEDTRRWRYGYLHEHDFPHTPFSNVG